MNYENTLEFARHIHSGQVDKSGQPYIEHVIRVAEAVRRITTDEDVWIAALLHDAIEDGHVTADGLRQLGYSGRIIDMVVCLTRFVDRYGEKERYHLDYIGRIKYHPWAALVKIADLQDNISRLGDLPEKQAASMRKRYERALEILQTNT